MLTDRPCQRDTDCQGVGLADAGPAVDAALADGGGAEAGVAEGGVAEGGVAEGGVADGGGVDAAVDGGGAPAAFCEPVFGRCALPGNCTPGGLCGPHDYGNEAAAVGDPCESDLDCPGTGGCLVEEDLGFGVEYRNGYCVVRGCSFADAVPEYACPEGSTCHNLFYGGLCHKRCALDDPASCRGVEGDQGGDYECYAWDRLTLGDIAVSDGPVCQSAMLQTCDSLGTHLDCSALGVDEDNPTQMVCRDLLSGGTKSDPFDPSGVCLDNTASGPFVAAVDGGVDAAVDGGADGGADGAVDAGVDSD